MIDAAATTLTVDPRRVGTWGDAVRFRVQPSRTVAYARATNDDHAGHLSGEQVPPVFAIIPVWDAASAVFSTLASEAQILQLVHGEQHFRFDRPIMPGDELVSRACIAGIHQKRSGATVVTRTQTRTAGGELVNEQHLTGFFRTMSITKDVGGHAPRVATPPELTSRRPDHVHAARIDPDQPRRYAAASGDHNRIHLDDEVARSVGLPGVIVHGLCTLAMAAQAIISACCDGDPARLRQLQARFAVPVEPGDTITTSIWSAPDGPTGAAHFQVTRPDGSTSISDGYVEVLP